MKTNLTDTKYSSAHYAQAIFDLAIANQAVEQVENELKVLKDAIVFNLDLKKYLSDPSIRISERINTLLELFGKDYSKVIRAFSAMLIILDSQENIEQIYNDYIEITNRFKKQISIEVISAIELDNETLSLIKKEVDLKTGLDVRIKNTIDSNIIGGIVIKIGEQIIDLSVKNKIEDMRIKLKSLEIRGEDFGTEN